MKKTTKKSLPYKRKPKRKLFYILRAEIKGRYDVVLELKDTRLDIFEYFGDTRSREARIGSFLTIYGLCNENALKRVPVKTVFEALTDFLNSLSSREDDEDEEEEIGNDGLKKEGRMYNDLVRYGLFRTVILYDNEECREVRYTCLTGQAGKLYGFLEDYAREDLKETKDVNIHSATVNTEILFSKRENPLDYAYALEALQKNILDLIDHMSSYNASFTDYMIGISRDLSDRRKASDTLHRLMTSNYIREYLSFTSNANRFRAAINRIAKRTDQIQRNEGRFSDLVEARLLLLRSQGDGETDFTAAAETTGEILSKINDMCVYDYGYFMSEIRGWVTQVLNRIKILTDSFAADGKGGLCARLLKVLRGCEETGAAFPECLMDAYDCRYAQEWSLKPKASAATRVGEYEDTNVYVETEDDGTFMDEAMRLQLMWIDYMEKYLPPYENVNIQNLPCRTPDEYYCAITTLNYAGEAGSPEHKELFVVEEESSDSSAENTSGYVLPDIVVRRVPVAAE